MGEMPILSGMLFCADCGAKLYQRRGRNLTHEQEYFVCARYRKKKNGCTNHSLKNVAVEALLLDGIRNVTAFTRDHEDEFVEMVTKKKKAEMNQALRDSRHELEQAQARIHRLDDLIQRLYEDNVDGEISDDRFSIMTERYEAEQKDLQNRVKELREAISAEQESNANVDRFLTLVRKYTDVQELTAELIRAFVEKVIVHQAEKIDGHRVQKVRIVWNCIGEIDVILAHIAELQLETAGNSMNQQHP